MGQYLRSVTPPLVDPFGIPITYCKGLADARILNAHYVLFTGYTDVPDLEQDGFFERQVAFRIAMERPEVPSAVRMTIARVGGELINEKLPSVWKFAA